MRLNSGMTVGYELKTIWKEAVMAWRDLGKS